jgi:shikimate kinase
VNAIFLTGFMGTGKSAIGRLLAERLGRPFVDTDAEVERETGATIAAIFRDRGESDFRRLESTVLTRAAAVDGAIFATGGGAPTIAENRRRMHECGTIVRLAAAPETVLERVGGGDDRPLLAGAPDRAARVRELLAAREDAYADADLVVDTTGLAPAAVVDRIVDVLSRGKAERR